LSSQRVVVVCKFVLSIIFNLAAPEGGGSAITWFPKTD
jgi:hypothetical protein